MDHCRKCGARLVPLARATGKHDSISGAPTQHEWVVCPQWRHRFIFGNGHDWWHRGEQRIDGVGLSNPMKMENPPRPPAV